MNTTNRPPRGRHLAGLAAFGAAATTMWGYGEYEALAHKPIAWGPFVVAAFVGAAAYGVGRASALSQVVSRGIAWAALAPAAVVLWLEATEHDGRVDAWTLVFTATLAFGLLVSRPLLHTERARRDFHPVAVRRSLLAGSIGSVAASMVAGFGALASYDMHQKGATGLAAAALALGASAVGVVRMRTWGVLLGGLTSAALLVSSLSSHGELALLFALAAAPGAWVVTSVIFARLRPETRPLAPVRVAELTPVRTRVAVEDDFLEELSASRTDAAPRRHPRRCDHRVKLLAARPGNTPHRTSALRSPHQGHPSGCSAQIANCPADPRTIRVCAMALGTVRRDA